MLAQTNKLSEQRSFYKANDLDSDIDMVGVIRNSLLEEQKRQTSGEGEAGIFIRPDHGHQMMGENKNASNPGYSGVGRLKRLAEIRGVSAALSAGM